MADAGSERGHSELNGCIACPELGVRCQSLSRSDRFFRCIGRSRRLPFSTRVISRYLPDRFKTLSRSMRRSLATGAVLTRS